MKYAEVEALFKRRAKGRDFKVTKDKGEIRQHGAEFHYTFKYWGNTDPLKIIFRPDDSAEIHLPPEMLAQHRYWIPSFANRIKEWTGAYVGSDNKRRRKGESHLRIHDGEWMKKYDALERFAGYKYIESYNLPFINGLIVRNGEVLNAQICIERKRESDSEKRLEIQRKLRPLAKLMRVCAKIDALKATGDHHYWTKRTTRTELLKRTASEIAAGCEPTHEMAEELYDNFAFEGGWTYSRADELERARLRRGYVDAALRALTEVLYKETGVYQYTEATIMPKAA